MRGKKRFGLVTRSELERTRSTTRCIVRGTTLSPALKICFLFSLKNDLQSAIQIAHRHTRHRFAKLAPRPAQSLVRLIVMKEQSGGDHLATERSHIVVRVEQAHVVKSLNNMIRPIYQPKQISAEKFTVPFNIYGPFPLPPTTRSPDRQFASVCEREQEDFRKAVHCSKSTCARRADSPCPASTWAVESTTPVHCVRFL